MLDSTEDLRLGVFDINGTIHTDPDGVPSTVVSGVRNLQDQWVLTSIVTGRSLARARELLGDGWNSVVSVGMAVSSENGARFSSPDGRNLQFRSMAKLTIDAVIDAVNSNQEDVRYLAYTPRTPGENSILWLPENGSPDKYLAANGQDTTIVSESLLLFSRRMILDRVGMLRVGSSSPAIAESLMGTNMFINAGEINVLEQGVNKSLAVMDIAEYADIPLSQTLVAGNDHNDVPMLNLPVKESILVGDDVVGLEPKHTLTQVASPEELGDYLSKMDVFGVGNSGV